MPLRTAGFGIDGIFGPGFIINLDNSTQFKFTEKGGKVRKSPDPVRNRCEVGARRCEDFAPTFSCFLVVFLIMYNPGGRAHASGYANYDGGFSRRTLTRGEAYEIPLGRGNTKSIDC